MPIYLLDMLISANFNKFIVNVVIVFPIIDKVKSLVNFNLRFSNISEHVSTKIKHLSYYSVIQMFICNSCKGVSEHNYKVITLLRVLSYQLNYC